MTKLQRFFVGTYSRGGGDLFTVRLDRSRAELSCGPIYTGLESPSFVAGRGECLYAASERENGGAIASFRVDESGALTRTALIDAPYPALCHACVWPDGKAVSFASYLGGGVLTCALCPDGSLDGEKMQWLPNEGKSVNPARQERPHVHSLTADPAGRFFVEADLGTDRLRIFRPEGTRLVPHAEAVVPAGDGPRHFVFHPNGRYAYLITELSCHVLLLDYAAGEGTLTLRQRCALLDQDPGTCLAADIHLTPDNRYLFASVRGTDALIRFAIGDDGTLSQRTNFPCGANAVRNFCIVPGFLLAADQKADEVRLFALDPEKGSIGECLSVLSIPAPVCIIAG